MRPRFVNYAESGAHKGYDLVPIVNRPDLSHFALLRPNMLHWVDAGGTWWIPAEDEYDTDLASTPSWLQWVPTLKRSRFVLPAIFHDGDYRFHACRKSTDQGRTWTHVKMTRSEADYQLGVRIMAPPSKGNIVQSDMYWAAVRVCGWRRWGHGH